MEIIYKVDAGGAYNALNIARDALQAGGRALGTGAELLRRTAVDLSPKAHGDLSRNIITGRIGMIVYEVVSRSAHSRYVEEGTGIYGPRRAAIGNQMLPNAGVARIAAWIARKGIRAKFVTQEELPWIIARKIARDGTRAQPFMEPAFKSTQPRIQQLVRAAITRAINRANQGATA